MHPDIHQQDTSISRTSAQPATPLNTGPHQTPPASGGHRNYIELPEYETSLATRHVVVDQLVIARHALCIHARHIEHLEKVQADSVRLTYAHYLPKLWQLYEETEGKIIESYFCYQTLAGVILNKKGDLIVRYLPQDVAHVSPGFESTLWKCTVQARLANQLLLRWGGRMVLLRRLFALTVYLLTVLDSQTPRRHADEPIETETDRIKSALNNANRELKDTKTELRRLASRDTQWLYLLGMVPSVILLGFISSWVARTSTPVIDGLLIALVAGGLGATVSVMNRASSGKLDLDYQAGWVLTGISGFFRPILGAIFGLAVYVFLNAGLIQIAGLPTPQGTEANHLFFFSAIAFLSGFSERWAKDILSLSMPNSGDADDLHAETLDHSEFHLSKT